MSLCDKSTRCSARATSLKETGRASPARRCSPALPAVRECPHTAAAAAAGALRPPPAAAGKPLFGTLISLLHNGTPVLGIIDQPYLRERWVGAAGQPSQLNGRPIRTRECGDIGAAYMYATTPHMFSGELARSQGSGAGPGAACACLCAGWECCQLELLVILE